MLNSLRARGPEFVLVNRGPHPPCLTGATPANDPAIAKQLNRDMRNSLRQEYSHGYWRLARRPDGNTHEQPVPTDVPGLPLHAARPPPATFPVHFDSQLHRNSYSRALILIHRHSPEMSQAVPQRVSCFCSCVKKKLPQLAECLRHCLNRRPLLTLPASGCIGCSVREVLFLDGCWKGENDETG